MDRKICGVCQRVLDLYEDDEITRWQHTLQDQMDLLVRRPHEAVPVDMPEGYRSGRCDFCNKFGIDYELPVRDFQIPEFPHAGSRDSWAACSRCAGMIRQHDWERLMDQAIARMSQEGLTDPESIRRMRQLYKAVRRNISGPMRKVQ